MKVIVVSGSRSGVGKTYVAEQVLRYFKDYSALKVTVNKGNGCVHHKDCDICQELQNPFLIIKDKEIINQAGKDTARLKQAGAKEVIWLKAKPKGLKQGLHRSLAEFSECSGVVIEGTSVLKFIQPDLNIHVYERGKWKIC